MTAARGPSEAWVDFRAVKEAVSMEAILRYLSGPKLAPAAWSTARSLPDPPGTARRLVPGQRE
jgi:hypothetical protein